MFSYSSRRSLLSLRPEEQEVLGADLASAVILLGWHHRASLLCEWAGRSREAEMPEQKLYEAAGAWRASLRQLVLGEGARRARAFELLRVIARGLPPQLRGRELEEVAPALCPHLGLQVFAYAGSGGSRLVYSFPPGPRPELAPVFLYRGRISNTTEASRRSLSLITDYENFFRRTGSECFNCGRVVKGLAWHRCARGKLKSCFACCGLRIQQSAKLSEDRQTRRYYCRAGREGGRFSCDRCGMRADSEECLARHRSNNRCRPGRVCGECGQFMYGKVRPEESHVCNQVRCARCFEHHDKDDTGHQCKMDMGCRQPGTLPRLAFYDFETSQDDGSMNCFECFALERRALRESGRRPGRSDGRER